MLPPGARAEAQILTTAKCYARLITGQRETDKNPEDGSCVFKIDVVINFEMYSVFNVSSMNSE